MTADEASAASKARSRQVEPNNYTKTLLNCLTLEQIRGALFKLSPERKLQIKRHADAEETLLKLGRSPAELQHALLSVESATPFKHCIPLRLIRRNAMPAPAIGTRFKSGNIEFRLAHVVDSPVPSLTFEHFAEFKEWVNSGADLRKRVSVTTRQPIVVRFHPQLGILTLNYPGVSHSGADGGPASYEDVVESLITLLKGEFQFALRTLPLKSTLKLFLEGPNKRVLRVKADVDVPWARLDMSSKQEGGTVENALGEFIAKYLDGIDKSLIADAAKKAFNEATLNSLVLFWIQESLFTRLRFWNVGAEFFFIWNKEEPSYFIVDSIIKLLATTQELAGDGDGNAPLDWIAKQPAHTVITPGELALRKELEATAAKGILVQALSAGLVVPVYRFRTSELILDFDNHWTPNLQSFRRELRTENGGVIDGANPENIEVAFLRIAEPAAGGKQ